MNGEPNWPNNSDTGYKSQDELSHEEVLRVLAGLDERLRDDAETPTLSWPGVCFTAGWETTAGSNVLKLPRAIHWRRCRSCPTT